jgi:tetratricopeptide (TPR) repeat protein
MLLLMEKAPLAALSLLSCAITLFAERGAVNVGAEIRLPWRIANMVAAYAGYLASFVWPAGLAVFYPHPNDHLPFWKIALSLMLLSGISLAVCVCRWSRPYLAAGWLWYLVMLAPVIGVFQVGLQSMADRYTYLPMIGIAFALAWLVQDWAHGVRWRRVACALCSVVVLASLSACAWRQTTYWRNSELLWTRVQRCTTDNPDLHYYLGRTCEEQGRLEEAIGQYRTAIRMKDRFWLADYFLGHALVAAGRSEEALSPLQRAIAIQPGYAPIHYVLGVALQERGRLREAIEAYRAAVNMEADFAAARNNLAAAYAEQGDLPAAVEEWRKTVEIDPNHTSARENLQRATEELEKSRHR